MTAKSMYKHMQVRDVIFRKKGWEQGEEKVEVWEVCPMSQLRGDAGAKDLYSENKHLG